MNTIKHVLFLVFSISLTLNAQKKQSKSNVMATIICECLENETEASLSNNFEEKLNECYKASVLGALISQVPTDKDSTITLNTDGTSDEVTDKDKKKALKLLEKDCDVFKTQVENIQKEEEYINAAIGIACQCVGDISTSISTEEKNEYISDCVASGAVDSNVIENLNLKTVEEMKGITSLIKRRLVDDCPELKRLVFSNDEDKLFAYSSNKKAAEYYNKGIDEGEKGNYKKALKLYKKAVEIDENFVYAWDNLGRTYRELHDYDNAIEAYKKSIAIDSLNPTPLMNIAVVYNYKEDYESAAFWYNKLIDANPKNPEGHYGLSLAYMYSGKLEASLNSVITAHNLYRESSSPYVADAEKVMQYLYGLFEEQNKEDRFKKICKERDIKIQF